MNIEHSYCYIYIFYVEAAVVVVVVVVPLEMICIIQFAVVVVVVIIVRDLQLLCRNVEMYTCTYYVHLYVYYVAFYRSLECHQSLSVQGGVGEAETLEQYTHINCVSQVLLL